MSTRTPTTRSLPTKADIDAALNAIFAIEQKLPLWGPERSNFYAIRVQLATAWDATIVPLIRDAERREVDEQWRAGQVEVSS